MSTPESTTQLTEAFLDRTLARIRNFMLILAGSGVLLCLIIFGWAATMGFAAVRSSLTSISGGWGGPSMRWASGYHPQQAASAAEGSSFARFCAMSSSPPGPMLYLMFPQLGFTASSAACAFRLPP